MSPAQTALYWREWGACSRALRARGRPAGNDARHALQCKALGHPRSSKTLTNAEFDKVLAAFRAESRPDDLNAQLRQIDQPGHRIEDLRERCLSAVLVFIKGDSLSHRQALAGRYLEALAMRVCRGHYWELDERGYQKITGIVERRAAKVEASARASAVQAGEESDNTPF